MAELFTLKMYFYCLKIKVTDLEMLSFDQSFLKVNNFSMPGWKLITFVLMIDACFLVSSECERIFFL